MNKSTLNCMERWLKTMMKQVTAAVDKWIELVEEIRKYWVLYLWSLKLTVTFYKKYLVNLLVWLICKTIYLNLFRSLRSFISRNSRCAENVPRLDRITLLHFSPPHSIAWQEIRITAISTNWNLSKLVDCIVNNLSNSRTAGNVFMSKYLFPIMAADSTLYGLSI
jgi:hypothetical protein